jgi:hypothetical protein
MTALPSNKQPTLPSWLVTFDQQLMHIGDHPIITVGTIGHRPEKVIDERQSAISTTLKVWFPSCIFLYLFYKFYVKIEFPNVQVYHTFVVSVEQLTQLWMIQLGQNAGIN